MFILFLFLGTIGGSSLLIGRMSESLIVFLWPALLMGLVVAAFFTVVMGLAMYRKDNVKK
jgi:hypothetical protein